MSSSSADLEEVGGGQGGGVVSVISGVDQLNVSRMSAKNFNFGKPKEKGGKYKKVFIPVYGPLVVFSQNPSAKRAKLIFCTEKENSSGDVYRVGLGVDPATQTKVEDVSRELIMLGFSNDDLSGGDSEIHTSVLPPRVNDNADQTDLALIVCDARVRTPYDWQRTILCRTLGKTAQLQPVELTAIAMGAEVLPAFKVQGVWQYKNKFGITFELQDLLVLSERTPAAVEAPRPFAFSFAPASALLAAAPAKANGKAAASPAKKRRRVTFRRGAVQDQDQDDDIEEFDEESAAGTQIVPESQPFLETQQL